MEQVNSLQAENNTIDQEIKQNFRHNFIVNALDGASYWFGYSFIAPTVILPLYISHLTDYPIIIGLISFVNSAGFLLPQLFTSNFVERAPRKKFFPVNLGFFLERLPVFLLTLSAIFFAGTHPQLALILFFVFYAWYSAGAGLIIVGWQDMIAKIIPVDRRGRFFGITNFIGNASGIVGALFVPFLFQEFPFPTGFGYSFIIASVLIFLSWFFLSLTKEPPLKTSKPHISQREYLRSLPRIVKKDHNFSQYILYAIIFAVSGMANSFLIVYASKNWNLSDSQAGGYNIAMLVGQSLATLFFGFIADRKGHKLCLEISAAMNVLSFALPIFATDPLWFYPIFFLRGVTTAANVISGMSIVMEFSLPEDRPTYIGLANTVPGVFSTIAPLVGGWLAGSFGYSWLFILSTLTGIAGFIMLRWMVREPRFLTPILHTPVEVAAQQDSFEERL